MWPRIRRIRGHGVTRQHMHYLSSRNRRAVGLTGILSLTISLLPTVASPASAATDGSGTEDVSIEIVIKSDDEVTMTFLATTPSDDEQSLKDFCVDENFSDDSVKPEVTFSSDHGTPTCKAVVTTPVSGNEYVSHDGDEYVVDTHVDSASEEDKNSSLKLSVVFPGKVTDSGGGRIEGDKQNKVSFTDFYDNKTRGKDSAEVTSESQSDSRSDTRTGFLIAVVLIVFITVVGGMIAFFNNSNKKRREQRYLAALKQQSLNAAAAAPPYQAFPYTSPGSGAPGAATHPQAYYPPGPQQGSYPPPQAPPVNQAGYWGGPAPYQQPPGAVPPGAGGPYPPPGQGGYGGY